MVIRLLSICILILCVSSWVWASVPEEAADLFFILRANPIQISYQKGEAIPFSPRESTPIRLFSTGLIRIYQKYISTQDRPACNFFPSCSRFGMGSIQRYGFFRGILLTADRLLRDNGIMLHTHYPFDEASGKYIDPVEAYSREALTHGLFPHPDEASGFRYAQPVRLRGLLPVRMGTILTPGPASGEKK